MCSFPSDKRAGPRSESSSESDLILFVLRAGVYPDFEASGSFISNITASPVFKTALGIFSSCFFFFSFPVRASRCYSCAVFSFRMCQDLIPPLLFFKKKAKWQLRWIEVNTWKAQSMNDTDTILSFFFHHPLFENDHPLTSKLKSKRIFFIFYKWALGLFAVAMLPACLSPSM